MKLPYIEVAICFDGKGYKSVLYSDVQKIYPKYANNVYEQMDLLELYL